MLKTALELKPDVIVADISMPLMNGLEAGARLKEVLPRMKLIYLTTKEDPDLAVEALRCGASGYLPAFVIECAVNDGLGFKQSRIDQRHPRPSEKFEECFQLGVAVLLNLPEDRGILRIRERYGA